MCLFHYVIHVYCSQDVLIYFLDLLTYVCFRLQQIPKEDLLKELDKTQASMIWNEEQKVLCHMDTWSHNIIYNKEKGDNNNTLVQF